MTDTPTPTIEGIAAAVHDLLAAAGDHTAAARNLQAAIDNQIAATAPPGYPHQAAVAGLREIVLNTEDPAETFQAAMRHWRREDTDYPPAAPPIAAAADRLPKWDNTEEGPEYNTPDWQRLIRELSDLQADAAERTSDYRAAKELSPPPELRDIERPPEWQRRYDEGAADERAGIDNGRTRERWAHDDAYRAGRQFTRRLAATDNNPPD